MRRAICSVVSSRSGLGAFIMAKGQKAPTGKWRPAEPVLVQALGHFLIAWSTIEATLEVCIAKQLRLKPLEGSIITAGLMFQARASILLSLLNRAPQQNTDAIRIVKEIQNIQDRNDILHSVIGGNRQQIWFNRRRTKEKFSSKIEVYHAPRLAMAALRCAELSSALMASLGVNKRYYLRFFQHSHTAANKDRVSP